MKSLGIGVLSIHTELAFLNETIHFNLERKYLFLYVMHTIYIVDISDINDFKVV